MNAIVVGSTGSLYGSLNTLSRTRAFLGHVHNSELSKDTAILHKSKNASQVTTRRCYLQKVFAAPTDAHILKPWTVKPAVLLQFFYWVISGPHSSGLMGSA